MKKVLYLVKAATVMAAIVCVAACGNRGQNSGTKTDADTLTTTQQNSDAKEIADNISWNRTDDGTLTISGTGDMPDYGGGINGGAPWGNFSINKKVVIIPGITSIGKMAFYGCSDLTSVIIPNTVTKIGNDAFSNCYSLTSVAFPNSITEIGDMAFSNCYSLTSVIFPNSLTVIGNSAFVYCYNLESITFSNSLTVIGSGAFSGCRDLTSVTIPNSVTEIGSAAFFNCENLTSVNIPNSITKMGDNVFAYCPGLPRSVIEEADRIKNAVHDIAGNFTWNFANGTLTISGTGKMSDYDLNSVKPWHEVNRNEIKKVVITPGVTSIGNTAFIYCEGLTSVTIPNSVTKIGERAFEGCSGLTSVTIPNSVTEIGENAFHGCSGLTSITIPNTITKIEKKAFYYCSGLTSVTIPNSVTEIGVEAFYSKTILNGEGLGLANLREREAKIAEREAKRDATATKHVYVYGFFYASDGQRHPYITDVIQMDCQMSHETLHRKFRDLFNDIYADKNLRVASTYSTWCDIRDTAEKERKMQLTVFSIVGKTLTLTDFFPCIQD